MRKTNTQIKLGLLILLIIPSLVLADEVSNWYFDFISEPVEASGTVKDRTGQKIDTFTSTIEGTWSDDGTEFIESAQEVYKRLNGKMDSASRWKRADDGTFIGAYKNSHGVEVTYTLTMLDGNRFIAMGAGPQGSHSKTTAVLDEDGRLKAKTVLKSKEGEIIVVVNLEATRAK